ncbi:hypothetical protein BD769DRAFT_1677132 [Suillus cothurnatus]|nr:hypothetical protein BD769DRAFT_1677132 [Suillus cothurnatus]
MSISEKVSHLSSLSMHTTSHMRTVVVLGGSYGGSRAAQVLAEGLPQGWRVVLTYESYTVLTGHERKAFFPYYHIPSSSLSTSIDMHQIILSPNLLDRCPA